jgi:hypothetical protein
MVTAVRPEVLACTYTHAAVAGSAEPRTELTTT